MVGQRGARDRSVEDVRRGTPEPGRDFPRPQAGPRELGGEAPLGGEQVAGTRTT